MIEGAMSAFCRLILVVSMLCVSSSFTLAEDGEEDAERTFFNYSLKGAQAFHRTFDANGEEVDARAPDEHLMYMLEDSEKSLGSESTIFLLSVRKYKNALAFMKNSERGILVDEDEFDVPDDGDSESHKRNHAMAAFSLAHEIGHHFCKHLASSKKSAWQQELEADQIAGWILAKSTWAKDFYDLNLDHIIDAGSGGALGDEQGSDTHPPLSKRIAALRAGWSGEPVCGAG